jgi:DNA-binding NarL/FixJ family response regulator
MNPKKSAVQWPDRAQPFPQPFGRPRLVFARDDATGSDKQPGMSERILLVEDDFLVAMQMESTLTEAGFEVVGVASSGEDAIELAISERPRLVVMDIRLAGDRDGIDTALQLFAEHGLRCIFATAHQDEPARRRAAPAAPLGWLQKPYSMPSLVEMVLRSLKELGGEAR